MNRLEQLQFYAIRWMGELEAAELPEIPYAVVEYTHQQQDTLVGYTWKPTKFGSKALVGPCPECNHQDGIDQLAFGVIVESFMYERLRKPAEPKAEPLRVACRCSTPHPGAPSAPRSGCGRWAEVDLPSSIEVG